MAQLCRDNGVELILVKAPSLYPYWYEEYDAQISEFAVKNELAYYNFAKEADRIGLDYSTDTYDAGAHLNVFGAEKLTDYFGRILSEEHGLADRRGESATAGLWEML